MRFLKYAPCITLLFLLPFFASDPTSVHQTKPPFWNEIQQFKKQDSINFPPANGVLFVGSSSFRMWEDLETVYKEYDVINRGFGGSNLLEAKYYAEQIIFPYRPRQIVIYSGENDIAGNVDAQQTLKRFVDLFETIRLKLPMVPIAFVSIKPSPSRMKFMPVMKESNQLIKTYLQKHKNTGYIDVFSLMLDDQGKPKADIFIGDRLHMNKKGYLIWQKAIEPYLIKT